MRSSVRQSAACRLGPLGRGGACSPPAHAPAAFLSPAPGWLRCGAELTQERRASCTCPGSGLEGEAGPQADVQTHD